MKKTKRSTNGSGPPAAMLPIYPNLKWEPGDYAKLQMRLDLFDDAIVATRYRDGKQAASSFVVDPLDLGQALAGLEVATGLLPHNVLFWSRRDGQERIGVYIPPAVYQLRVEPSGPWPNRTIPLPGFVFVGQGKTYSLYALADDGWPGAQTELYHPPTPNVGGNGVCTGNVEFPPASAATIWRAVAAFFESGFNNHLDNGKSKKYPKGVLQMWRVLNRAKAERYPVADLEPVRGMTLSKLAMSN